MFHFNFLVPFIVILVLFAFIVTMHVIYRKNAQQIIESLTKDISDLEDNLYDYREQLAGLTDEHHQTVKNLNEAFKKEHCKLKTDLANAQQLATDLQKTLTALRLHKANQRNVRKNNQRNHSQQGQTK